MIEHSAGCNPKPSQCCVAVFWQPGREARRWSLRWSGRWSWRPAAAVWLLALPVAPALAAQGFGVGENDPLAHKHLDMFGKPCLFGEEGVATHNRSLRVATHQG